MTCSVVPRVATIAIAIVNITAGHHRSSISSQVGVGVVIGGGSSYTWHPHWQDHGRRRGHGRVAAVIVGVTAAGGGVMSSSGVDRFEIWLV